MKKILSTCLAVSFAVGGVATFASCGASGEKIDKTKTQLYVSHFTAGFGNEWIHEMDTKFEEAYKDVSFEDGKTGVQVIVSEHRNTASNKNFDKSTDKS